MPIEIDNRIKLDSERQAKGDEAVLALGKSLTDERINKIRDTVSPCVVDVDHVIRIKGKFVVHADYEKRQVNKACPWTFLAVAWNKMNEATRNACVQEVQQMVSSGIKPESDIFELKEVTKAAVTAIKNNTKSTSRGSCKFNGVIWVSE